MPISSATTTTTTAVATPPPPTKATTKTTTAINNQENYQEMIDRDHIMNNATMVSGLREEEEKEEELLGTSRYDQHFVCNTRVYEMCISHIKCRHIEKYDDLKKKHTHITFS